jgi:hypothetical protein
MCRILPALVVSLASLAGLALAQNAVTRESTTTAKVDRIERSSRVVTFRSDGNVLQDVYVDPSFTAFNDLRVGDVVTVRYTESVIVQLRPNARLTDVQDTTEQAKKAGDPNVVQQLKTVVTIENIDSQGLFVTYRTSDNMKAVRHVQDKKLLEGIRPGDRVEVTVTRARALSIERKR